MCLYSKFFLWNMKRIKKKKNTNKQINESLWWEGNGTSWTINSDGQSSHSEKVCKYFSAVASAPPFLRVRACSKNSWYKLFIASWKTYSVNAIFLCSDVLRFSITNFCHCFEHFPQQKNICTHSQMERSKSPVTNHTFSS